MTVIVCRGIVLVVCVSASYVQAQSVDLLLQRGIYQEETGGDLDAAILTYQQIVDHDQANRPHVAQAIYRLGICELKRGQTAKSLAHFEHLISNFPDQARLVASAERRLDELGAPIFRPRRMRHVWSHTGLTQFAEVSPDGRFVVYRENNTGNMRLRDLENGKERKLTKDAGNPLPGSTHATFSGDGKWIAYSWLKPTLTPLPDVRCDLRVIRLDGSEQRTILNGRKSQLLVPCDWTPDGRHVLARVVATDKEATQLVLISVADGSIQELKAFDWRSQHCPNACVSPAGNMVAFEFYPAGESENVDIGLLELNVESETVVIAHPAEDKLVGWTPDGSSLVFRSTRSQTQDLWSIQIDAGKPQGKPQRLWRDLDRDGQMGDARAVVTDSGALFYAVRLPATHGQDLFLAELDDGGSAVGQPQRLVGGRNARIVSPEFSPDGDSLAYYRAPPLQDGKYRAGNIVIRSLDTGQERVVKLTPAFSDAGHWPRLRWHPNGGTVLLFGRNERQQVGLFQVDIASGQLTPLVLNDWKADWNSSLMLDGDNVSWGEYSPDGMFVFFTRVQLDQQAAESQQRTNWRLIKRHLTTGSEEVVCHRPDNANGGGNFYISPDGKNVLIGLADAVWLAPLELEKGEPRMLLRTEEWRKMLGELRSGFSNRIKWRIAWESDGRHLLFLKGGREGSELWRVSIEGGEPQLVDQVSTPTVTGLHSIFATQELRIHPDGDQIVYISSRAEPSEELRKLENFLPDLAGTPAHVETRDDEP